MNQSQSQTIRVVYPAKDGRIVLSTEHDWDRTVEAQSVTAAGTAEFIIETEQPFFYFKPVLVCEDGAHWSRGENFLAIATSGAPLEIHPYFDEETRCSVCELMSPLPSASGSAHYFRVFLPPGYYENTLKKYPVLYMHDGQNLFSKRKRFSKATGGPTKSSACSTK